jgi:hypothetical protein
VVVDLEPRQQFDRLLGIAAVKEDQRLVGRDGGRLGIKVLRLVDLRQRIRGLADPHQKSRVPMMRKRVSRIQNERALELRVRCGHIPRPVEIRERQSRMRARKGRIERDGAPGRRCRFGIKPLPWRIRELSLDIVGAM